MADGKGIGNLDIGDGGSERFSSCYMVIWR